MSLKQDLRPLRQAVESQGGTWAFSKGNHLRIANPANGAVLFTAATPSDGRGVKNFRSMLRRIGGFDV